MKKLCLSILLVFLPMMAVGQSNTNGIVIYEKDFTGITEYTYWAQFSEIQTDGKVEVDPDGIAITVGIQTGDLWQPQVMVIPDGGFDPDGSFNLEEGHNYKIVITAKFPTEGTLQINMGSWGANDEDQFYVNATGNFQEVECEFIDWSVTAENAHLLFQCGDFKGTTILKKIQVIEYVPSNYDIWTIAGDEILLGEDWNVSSIHNYMRTIDGINYTLTKKDIMLSKGTYHFKAYKYNTTNDSYPSNNASLVIEEDAVYSVKFTFNANTKSVSATATKTGGLFYNFITKGKVAELKQISTNVKGNISIPEKVTHEGEEFTVNKILNNALSGCTGITSVTIPNSVTSIGQYAFQNCSKLTSVTLPSNMSSIGDYVFYGCTGLTSFTIPSSVTSIGNYAFSGCSGLKNVTIPTSVTSIGGSAFYGCSNLSSISIPNSITTISNYTFQGCTKLVSVTLPNNLAEIGIFAFSNCTSLTSMTFPNSVTVIGNNAYSGCTGLTSLTIPNNVTSICESAFSGCSGLTSLTIGEKVSYIYSSSFANCPNLADVYCLAESVPNTNSDAFDGSYIEYATLHVPSASLNSYSTAVPWRNFGNKVAIGGGEIPETQKCAKPTITFKDGKLTFTCATQGVEFISEITAPAMTKKYDNEISLSSTYTVTVFATKVGYINSDKVSIEIQANSGIKGDLTDDGKVDVADHVELSNIIMGK